jgi:hypothetical protein
MEYSTAAAIGSNILAAFALAVAYASYRLSRRTESRLQDESEPTLSAKIWLIENHPKSCRVTILVVFGTYPLLLSRELQSSDSLSADHHPNIPL